MHHVANTIKSKSVYLSDAEALHRPRMHLPFKLAKRIDGSQPKVEIVAVVIASSFAMTFDERSSAEILQTRS